MNQDVVPEWTDNIVVPAVFSSVAVFIRSPNGLSLWGVVYDSISAYVAAAGLWMVFRLYRVGQGRGRSRSIRGLILVVAVSHALLGTAMYSRYGYVPLNGFHWQPLVPLGTALAFSFIAAWASARARPTGSTDLELLKPALVEAVAKAVNEVAGASSPQVAGLEQVLDRQGRTLAALSEFSKQLKYQEAETATRFQRLANEVAQVAQVQEQVEKHVEELLGRNGIATQIDLQTADLEREIDLRVAPLRHEFQEHEERVRDLMQRFELKVLRRVVLGSDPGFAAGPDDPLNPPENH